MWEMQGISRDGAYVLSEGQVEHAVKLFAGRQLCDEEGLTEEEAWAFIQAHWTELEDHMAESVLIFYGTHQVDDEEDDEDKPAVNPAIHPGFEEEDDEE